MNKAVPSRASKKNSVLLADGSVLQVRHKSGWQKIRQDWQLYTFLLLPLLFFAIFKYIPMLGNVIAFRRYRIGDGIFGSGPLTLRYFEQFINQDAFWHVFWNNVIIGLSTFAFTFPLPIILALLLNEVKNARFKKLVQSISYMPHFLSVVIIVGIVMELTASGGVMNQLLQAIIPGATPIMQNPDAVRPIYIISEIWQTTGWGTILYLAALTQIDDQLYEAARIDGANRWKQTLYITIPGIRHTMVVLLTLNIGTFLAVGFEKLLLLIQGNGLYMAQGDVISTYVYRVGLASPTMYSLGAAIGLFESVIGLALVFGTNALSRRLVGSSLW
ncbi:MAG: ABC transporter permease subunit [Propionibacteriaceae bacterium]|jgi:putative aldouronate transport system permease protein|nr:ABC transporter permease subunit [Propionibacteriaceae bacterium]